MRRRLSLSLIACWPLIGAPAALAAVPVGSDGTLRPRDGAELLEAVDLATSSGPGRPNPEARIVLAEGNYDIARPIVLDDPAGDTIVGEGTTITGTGAATTLLEIAGAASSARSLKLEPSATSLGTYPVVRLSDGAQLSGFFISIPESLPGVTAIETSGSRVRVETGEIESGATSPAIRSTGGLTLADGVSVYGGDPTLDLVGGASATTTTIKRSFLTGGPATTSVLRARTTSGASTVSLTNTTIRADADANTSALVDLLGASAPGGSLAFDAVTSTLAGPAASTAVRIARGAGATPTRVDLTGLLTLGSEPTVGCTSGPGSGPSVVRIVGIYRNGALSASPHCTVAETGRRSGGDPALTTASRLAWGSPAIDAITQPAGVDIDARYGSRASTRPATSTATPTDLGAVEYQYAAPALDDVLAEADGDDGRVRFSVAASDENEGEGDQLVVVWRFPDGETATGLAATHRFTEANPGDVIVTATDPSGLTTTARVTPKPQLDPLAIGDDKLAPSPSPAPQQTLPERVLLPLPTPLPQTILRAETGALKGVTRVQARAIGAARRASGLGAARTGEAAINLELDRATNVTVIVRRREGAKLLVVPNARFSSDTTAGTTALHLTARVGTATLRLGLYRVTILLRPAAGVGERRDLYMRIVR